ncbi:MAG: hypothetical protein ACREKS_12440 [Candidatus Rokuibacteriota bacterium]
MEFKGFGRKIFDGSQAAVAYLHGPIIRKDFLDKHPEIVVAYLKASSRPTTGSLRIPRRPRRSRSSGRRSPRRCSISTSATVSWICLISAEMISGQFGVGYFTWVAYGIVKYAQIVVGMLTMFFLSLSLLLGIYLGLPGRPRGWRALGSLGGAGIVGLLGASVSSLTHCGLGSFGVLLALVGVSTATIAWFARLEPVLIPVGYALMIGAIVQRAAWLGPTLVARPVASARPLS